MRPSVSTRIFSAFRPIRLALAGLFLTSPLLPGMLLSGQTIAEPIEEEHGYLSLQFGQLLLDTDQNQLSPDLPTLTAALGWKPFSLFGFELRGGAGLGESFTEVTLNGEQTFVSVQMDYYYSLLAKPQIRWRRLQVYGLAGFTEAQFQTAPDFAVRGLSEGFSYGMGLGYRNDENIGFHLETLSLIDADNIQLGGWNFSVEVPLW